MILTTLLLLSFGLLTYLIYFLNDLSFKNAHIKNSEIQFNERIGKIHTLMNFISQRLLKLETRKDIIRVLKDQYNPELLGLAHSQTLDIHYIIDYKNALEIGPYGLVQSQSSLPFNFFEKVLSLKNPFQIFEQKGVFYFILLKPSQSNEITKTPQFLALKIEKEDFLKNLNEHICFFENKKDIYKAIPPLSSVEKASSYITEGFTYKGEKFNAFAINDNFKFILLQKLPENNNLKSYFREYWLYYLALLLLSTSFSLLIIYDQRKTEKNIHKNYKGKLNDLIFLSQKQKSLIDDLEFQAFKKENHLRAFKETFETRKSIQSQTFKRHHKNIGSLSKKLEIIVRDLKSLRINYDFSFDGLLEIAKSALRDIDLLAVGIDRKETKEKILLRELIEKSLSIFGETSFVKNIHYIFNFSKECVDIIGDEYLLCLIFVNLIRYSLDRVSNEGTLKISTSLSTNKGYFYLQLWDNGYAFDGKKLQTYDVKQDSYNDPMNLSWEKIENLIILYGGSTFKKSQSTSQGNSVIIELPLIYNHKYPKNIELPKNVIQFPI